MAKKKAGKRRLDTEQARKKHKEVESRSSSDFHEMKEGWNYFFLMPPWAEDKNVIWHEIQQHRFLVCPRATAGKDCILCKEIRRRERKGDTDFADMYRLKSRAFFNAVRADAIKKKDVNEVKVLALSPSIFKEVLEWISDEDKDPSDVNAAVKIGIKRTGTGLKTRYKVKFGSEVDISEYVTDDILEALFDLETIRAALPASAKELRKAIRGSDGDDDGYDDDDDDDDDNQDEVDIDSLEDDDDDDDVESDTEEDEMFDEPDDDDDSDDDDSDDDDDDLDDLDDEDEEEEEEEEPPKPKKSAKKKSSKKKKSSGKKRK